MLEQVIVWKSSIIVISLSSQWFIVCSFSYANYFIFHSLLYPFEYFNTATNLQRILQIGHTSNRAWSLCVVLQKCFQLHTIRFTMSLPHTNRNHVCQWLQQTFKPFHFHLLFQIPTYPTHIPLKYRLTHFPCLKLNISANYIQLLDFQK